MPGMGGERCVGSAVQCRHMVCRHISTSCCVHAGRFRLPVQQRGCLQLPQHCVAHACLQLNQQGWCALAERRPALLCMLQGWAGCLAWVALGA